MSDLVLNLFSQEQDDKINEHHEADADEPQEHNEVISDIESEEPHDKADNDVMATPIELLRSMYQRDEQQMQNRQDNKRKIKLKPGHIVDVFSSSRNKWIQGMVLYIKDDTICVVYGKKKKWLHKTSPNFRIKSVPKPNTISPTQSLSPPAAYSSPVIVNDSPLLSSPSAFVYSSSGDSVGSASNRNALPTSYDVIFDSEILGLSFSAAEDGRNCVVYQCLSEFALHSVQCGSTVTAVNGKNVMDLEYTHIVDIIEQNARMPPLVLTFSKGSASAVEFEKSGWNMDALGLEKSANMKHLIENEGELYEKVICSQKIKKVNRKGKKQERVLVITQKAIYYLKYAKKSQRRIPIRDIGMVTLASDSFEFVIHVPSEYDAHFISENREEVILLLEELYFQETIDNLLVMYSNMKHLNDVVLNRKLSMREKRTSKVSIQRSISNVKDELDDLD